MASDIKLLPCPFCGGKADFGSTTRSWIKCKGCGFETDFVNDNEQLVNIWNTRKPMDRIVEQFEELDDDCGCGKIDVWKAIDIVKEGVKDGRND